MGVKSTWIPTWHQMDHFSWSLGLFSKTTSWGRPNTKPGEHGTPNAHNHWFILSYHVWGPAWTKKFIEIAFDWRHGHIWLHTTLEDPWPRYMILERCLGTAFGYFLLGSHNFMVAALGSCVKWPLSWGLVCQEVCHETLQSSHPIIKWHLFDSTSTPIPH